MELVAKLQKLDPEKFFELCRMHLTFNLDLHNDEFSALTDMKGDGKSKKLRNYFSRRIKAVPQSMPLTQENISQIYQIIEFLGRDTNVCNEGLFRKTGSLSRQRDLKILLSVGAVIDFSLGQYSVHDCACVLKGFLAELPEPLLSEAHYSAHCQISDMSKNMPPSQEKVVFLRQLKSTKLLLLLLPHDNYCLLKYLLLLLSQVRNAQERNKMTSTNLATLFAPHIICPRKMSPETFKKSFPRMVECVRFLIENATHLFEPPKELVQDVSLYMKEISSKTAPKEINPENEPVKTMIAFCDRIKVEECKSVDYTNKALSELQSYVQNLPNSARKRKLIKKFQKENASENESEPGRKHFRSRSVGDAIKKHLWKNKRRDYRYDMLASNSKSTESILQPSKTNSVEALYLEKRGAKLKPIEKNLLRASKKLKVQEFKK